MFRLSLYPIFDSYVLVAVIALVLAGLMWFGPRGENVGPRRRALLAFVRAAAIVLMILAMLRPTVIYTQTKKQAATLVVMLDLSRSMTVPDAIGDKPRYQAERQAVDDAAQALAKLQRDFELKAYGFDSQLHELPVEQGRIKLPDQPEGQETAIGASLEEVLRREAGRRLLGVVLMSDGAQRAYAPRDLPPQTAATRFQHLGCKMFTFPLGQSRGLGEARDVAVKELIANPTVFVKNELSISGQVRVDGYVNTPIPVRVLFETAPGEMTVVAQETVKPTADGQLLPIQLNYVPQIPGEYKLTLEASEQPGELVTTNNRVSTFVHVLKGGLNVLYIEGAFRIEEGRIRRALASSPDVKLDYVRIDPRSPKTRPADFGDRFKPGKYDVYILGDVDSSVFQGQELALLAETVSRGAGLIMLGGLQSFGAGGYSETPLAQVLPVGMGPLERQRLDDPVRSDLHWPGQIQMKPTQMGLRHFVLMLAGDPKENAALWAKLPPLDGANKFHDLAPNAQVLADAGPDKPLLVDHQFGSGRVMAFAGDSTWRWQMRDYEPAFKRFWRQIILWLARKDQAEEGNVWLNMAQRRYAPSQRVAFSVGAKSPTGDPLTDATYKAEIILPDGARRPLSLVRQNEQMSGSFFDTQTPGDYAIEVSATQKDQPLGSTRARFIVSQQDLELDNAAADVSTMQSLAAMTGGESLAPEQLPKLIEKLMASTQSLDIEQETKRTFWDTWPFFLTLVSLLGVEWYLRKRWGLV